jgi:cytoskeletal protein CcmA (bactofilin family)
VSVQPTTVVGRGARIEGDLHLETDAVLAGHVSGNVFCGGRLEVTADARIDGQLHATAAVLGGRVERDVRITGLAELRPGVALGGSLTAGQLRAEAGASFGGTLRLGPDVAAPAPPAAATRFPTSAAAADAEFDAVPGTLTAGIRPRRRGPLHSAG